MRCLLAWRCGPFERAAVRDGEVGLLPEDLRPEFTPVFGRVQEGQGGQDRQVQ